MDSTRRDLLKAAAALVVNQWAASRVGALSSAVGANESESDRKIVVVGCGGVRRAESFHTSGLRNIPHLFSDLLPQSLFYPYARNSGVTSHYNTISSILTGNWQRLDDWGKDPPQSPTIFEFARKQLRTSQSRAWFISSNKALTAQIGASADRDYGPSYGANVIFPKQLLVSAVVNAASHGRAKNSAERTSMQPELEAMLQANNFEGLGWSVFGESSELDNSTLASVTTAIEDLVHTTAPATGDEFTYLVSLEVIRRFTPSLMMITFSDMEVAHFGSYSLHLAGIRTLDRLIYELWKELEANPSYKDKTTLFVLPEFGRDLDGSVTNGFFNHRLDNDSTRLAWLMCLGAGVMSGEVVEREIQQVDICPTIAKILGLRAPIGQGQALSEISV